MEERICGTCSLCCKLPRIEELAKDAGEWCSHCKPGRGCQIYADRPVICRNFACAWLDHRIGHGWRPTTSHMVVYQQRANVLVLVDPAYPDAWKRQPYLSELEQCAAKLSPLDGFVSIFVKSQRVAVLPMRG
jgi:hypothetical protein